MTVKFDLIFSPKLHKSDLHSHISVESPSNFSVVQLLLYEIDDFPQLHITRCVFEP